MITNGEPLKVAILGSGNIGTDLLIKIQRSPWLDCKLFIGRNLSSPGLTTASALGVPISDKSIDAILDNPDCCEVVFDATSARDHLRHWPLLEALGKKVIDLTPSRAGKMCIPAVNLEQCLAEPNVNMITCGGQASVPLAHLIGKTQEQVEYVEVVSSISSRSAGPATRINIDEYIEATETALRTFSGAARAKAILILNPAVPCIDMQTTIFAKVAEPRIELLKMAVDAMVARIREYVPGYQIILGPILENGRIVIMIRVQGLGDYLPRYAGNLDIINCAAIAMAEAYAQSASGVGRAAELKHA
jgi:acetaldehyde dehydrogenase (acetylating)